MELEQNRNEKNSGSLFYVFSETGNFQNYFRRDKGCSYAHALEGKFESFE